MLQRQPELYDPRTGGDAVCVERVRLGRAPVEPPRSNYFTIYRIDSGSGTCWADDARCSFHAGDLLFFVPYQQIRFACTASVEADVVRFHANFLCVETFHAEAGCSGILFNDPFGAPVVTPSADSGAEFHRLIERIQTEQVEQAQGYREVMLAHLKVLLVFAARIKSAHGAVCRPGGVDPRHPLLSKLRDLIEERYCSLHAPADYAKLLHVTPKSLGSIVSEHLGLTLTEWIRNRILIHAKWQLLHTLRPVKEIARELGFADELYFSRLFKKATGCSPKFFREFETEIRGGSNLSISFGQAPIRSAAANSDS